ncbi:MAG: AN1-type zinc finger domain-containing protein [Candidatus Aenigmarchaeota archaeon]|nr:AN1-type zinc finger domain-containing protein [Candidatus Aenigmarchaeota archaeon]
MMPCTVCGKSEMMPYMCKFCSLEFCSQHRLPENHNCAGLAQWKNNRTFGKIIYPPMQDKAVGKRNKPELGEGILKAGITLFFLLALIVFILL